MRRNPTNRNERGQALVAALICLLVGALIITPAVSFAATSLKGVSLKASSARGLYAADAGVEDVIWSLKGGGVPNTSLPDYMNGMQVTMNTMSAGNLTLVAGEWITTGGPHAEDLQITSNLTWDDGASAYRYTITFVWNGPGLCKIFEVGARLPLGYDYEPESASLFPGNLSEAEPVPGTDAEGARLLWWSFPKTDISTRTQEFHISGSGDLEHEYAWAKAERTDVGEVSDLIGAFWVITATATRPEDGVVTGKVEVNVMLSDGDPFIISYRILK